MVSQRILKSLYQDMKINCILNDIQPLHEGRDSSPRIQNVDHLRNRSCTPGMQTPSPSLPISRDLSVTEVESTGILEDEESAISDAEQAHVSHNAKRTHWRSICRRCLSKHISMAYVTLSEIITKARRQNPGNLS
jgi:hypothetical protein